MNARNVKLQRRQRRRRRVRRRVFGTPEKPRLSVFRSVKNISAQVIDDISGRTLCSAGSNTTSLVAQIKNGGNCEAAGIVGRWLGERARMQGIRRVAFDRNGYKYHGRVKALAEAVRETGVQF